MKRSTERILTTHVGSLPRPPDLLDMIQAKEQGGPFDAAANQVARSLAGMGVRRGDRILWWGDTELDAVPVFGALARLGGVFAPLNARASLAEIGPVGEYAKPRIVVLMLFLSMRNSSVREPLITSKALSASRNAPLI